MWLCIGEKSLLLSCIFLNALLLRFRLIISVFLRKFADMKIKSSAIVFFSPTGTSRKVAAAVSEGCGFPSRVVDVTYQAPDDVVFAPDELVFVAVPVYGGKVAPLALQRLAGMRGNGTPAVPVVVYGNRAYEGALSQLADFLAQRGFSPIGAAAFVGEHSYSSKAYPIAVGRPDMTDIADAREFGKRIAQKLSTATTLQAVDVAQLTPPRDSLWAKLRFVWFVLRQRRQKRPVVKPAPIVDAEKCKRCGKCARLCPNGAISPNGRETNPERCTKCCACVKFCPVQARSFATPYAPILSRCFAARKSPVTLL